MHNYISFNSPYVAPTFSSHQKLTKLEEQRPISNEEIEALIRQNVIERRQAEYIIMNVKQNLGRRAIASKKGVSANTVKGVLNKAADYIKDKLRK